MNVLSLFAGVGGLDLGLEWAGMTVVGQVERDEYCRRVLARHWPEVPRHDDVRTTVDWWRSGPRPVVDLIAGGFPCQPVSVAGRQRGQADDRWLWPAMAEVIDDIRPRWVVAENVPGLRTRGLDVVLGDLHRLGYTARAGALSAAEMGAPHKRDRVFILAHTEGVGCGPGWARGADSGGPNRAVVEAPGMADADSEARGPAPGDALTTGSGRPVPVGAPEPRRRGSDVADTVRPGSPVPEPGRPVLRPATQPGWWAPQPRVDRGPDGLPAGLDRGDQEPWERGIPRVATGVPDQAARVRALGNAVVPQCAEFIAELILGAEAVAT